MSRELRRWERVLDAVEREDSLGAEYLGTCGDAGGIVQRSGGMVGPCTSQAGLGTDHPGWGRCSAHGGNGRAENMKAVVRMGHALGREMNISPLDAMLRSVRVAAGQAAWYDMKVAEAEDDEAVAPGGSHWHWVVAQKEAHRAVVSYSAIAIRAGVAKLMVEQVQAQAMALMPLLETVLGQLGEYAPATVVAQTRARLRQMLLALGTDETGTEQRPAELGGSEEATDR